MSSLLFLLFLQCLSLSLLASRSVLGSAYSHATEEVIDSQKNHTNNEDVVVMDYEQPHRKPPIHNESP
uniref:Root meristem growth factor 9-like n=1 Tax=Nelumbo nucifera TaxID=4432 RepID=A0A822ZPA5_NELNU|nr:TPA_asm: hypothetical protein HUJ06_017751 [Nelumbo nucifera]